MSSEKAAHAEDVELVSLLNGELPRRRASALRGHVSQCRECGARLSAIERTSEQYRIYHSHMLKALDPGPPQPWEDLRPRLRELEASFAPARTVRYRAWLAVAAGLVLAMLAVYRFQHSPKVSAAELLRKASAAAPAPNPARRIRVHSRKGSLVRPAVLRKAESPPADGELAALFAAATYNWDDPLSARSFAAWRDGLGDREDRVQTIRGAENAAEMYEIRTTTRSSVLKEATLVLSGDLQPVRETMRFDHETVELSRAEDAPLPPPAAVVAPAPRDLPAATPAPAGPAEELRLMAALHRIGADLGEPVEVSREGGALLVTGTGLTARREEQLREAVAGLPGVSLRFGGSGYARLGAGEKRRAGGTSGARTELQQRFGEEVVNRILDASEAVMARAFAIRALSKRFPAGVVARLGEGDRGVLAAMRGEHVAALSAHLRELGAALSPVLPDTPAASLPAVSEWQESAAGIFNSAQALDQLLNRMLAGDGDSSIGLPDVAQAFRKLEAELRAYPEAAR